MHEDRRELSTADLAARTTASDRTPTPPREAEDVHHELFGRDEAEPLRAQWSDIQAAFVDAPRDAVQRADALVAQVMQRMADTFARERATLEQQWDRGDNVTTEDLRVALQRYRAFFDRLLRT